MGEALVKELLQAKALGCLNPKENETFLRIMEENIDFPWEELGQYQNLVAYMPTLLEFEVPDPEVKNKIITELQNQIEAVQPAEEIIKEETPDFTETIEVIEDEELIIEEEEIILPDNQQEDKVDRKKSVVNGISIKDLEKPEIDVHAFKTAKSKEKQKDKSQISGVKKELPGKSPKNYISKFSEDEKVSRVGGNKILTIAGVVIVIILIVLLVMYLGLSSEIDNNKNEIEKLKQRIGSTVIQKETFPSEFRIT